MDVREKLVEMLRNSPHLDTVKGYKGNDCTFEQGAGWLIAHGVTVQEGARPIEEWNEDFGDVLWWKFPIEEPPYVGSPLDEKWSGYHTHWTFIPIPTAAEGRMIKMGCRAK